MIRFINNLPIYWKLAVAGGVAAGFLVINSTLEWWQVSNTAERIDALIASSEASNRQITADMMHDAVARDVMAGLLAQQINDEAYLNDAQRRMEQNLAAFNELLSTNASADLPVAAKNQVARTQAELNNYALTARRMLRSDHGSVTELTEAITRFDQQYDKLAQEMEMASDAIQLNNKDIADTAVQVANENILGTVVLAVAGVFFLTLVFWVLARTIVGPLLTMIQATGAYAREQYDVEPKGRRRGDEIGDLARSVDQLRRNSLEALELRRRVEMDRLEAERERNAALHAMAEKVETETRQAVYQVSERTGEMNDRAGRMATSAGLVSESSTVVAAAAQQTLQNNEAVASATEQLSASISEIAAQVSHAAAVTRRTVQRGNGAVDMIDKLGEAVGRIGEVTRLISEIAGQTNLLALNAAIEAARAGEMGKGFAVVASEVKSLATQTAQATEDITKQVADIEGAMKQATDAVLSMTRSLHEVDELSTVVAGAVEEQGAATAEIAQNVSQAAAAARETANRIATVSNEARNAGEEAVRVSRQTKQVAAAIQELRQTLVRVVRTATADVDRRANERLTVQRPVSLQVGVERIAAVLQNISVGGALVDGVGLPSQTRGRLDINDGGQSLDFAVVSQNGTAISMRFILPDPEIAMLEKRISRLAGVREHGETEDRKVGLS